MEKPLLPQTARLDLQECTHAQSLGYSSTSDTDDSGNSDQEEFNRFRVLRDECRELHKETMAIENDAKALVNKMTESGIQWDHDLEQFREASRILDERYKAKEDKENSVLSSMFDLISSVVE